MPDRFGSRLIRLASTYGEAVKIGIRSVKTTFIENKKGNPIMDCPVEMGVNECHLWTGCSRNALFNSLNNATAHRLDHDHHG